MKLLTKIRMSMVFLLLTTSWFVYWTQITRSLRQVERQSIRSRRTLNNSAVVKLNERLAYDFDEKSIGYNFVRPNFQYLIEPRHVHRRSCRTGIPPNSSWCMVNFVKSKANHSEHRNDLRRMWAHKTYYNGSRFDNVFVVGMSNDIIIETQLRMEQKIYGDILQYDGPDDYKYVPLKTMAGMQWAVDKLSRDHYYSSGDDDVMVMVDRLHKVMNEYIEISTKHDWVEFPIICTYRTMDFTRPYRNMTGRYKQWYIAKSEYKWPFFPRGCFGGFYSTSVRVVKLLLEAARTTPYLRVDDVWITGVLRLKLGMPDTMVIEPSEKIAFHGVGQLISKLNETKLHKNETSKALLKFIAVMPNMEA